MKGCTKRVDPPHTPLRLWGWALQGWGSPAPQRAKERGRAVERGREGVRAKCRIRRFGASSAHSSASYRIFPFLIVALVWLRGQALRSGPPDGSLALRGESRGQVAPDQPLERQAVSRSGGRFFLPSFASSCSLCAGPCCASFSHLRACSLLQANQEQAVPQVPVLPWCPRYPTDCSWNSTV